VGFHQARLLLLSVGALALMLIGFGVAPLYAGTEIVPAVDSGTRVAAIRRHRPSADMQRRALPETRDQSALLEVERHVNVMRGDTLGSILATAGLDAAGIARWTAATKPVFDVRRIRVGRSLTLEQTPGGDLASLRYEIDDVSTLVVERSGDEIGAHIATKPVVTELRGVSGMVERGLWTDVVAAGAPPAVASSLAGVFQGAVDFRRVAPGDAFRVLYEVATEADGSGERAGAVVGAEIQVRGRTYTAIRFTNAAGRASYYKPNGDAFGHGMLRYPIAHARVSSGFSLRRFHPILRRVRPHLGVDFAAPRGTPVRATVDGVVMLAGWKRGMGRMVRVRHAGSLETFYGHLDRIASGVRSGARVRQGQVIGYVGSTGLATGNHLHYGVRRDGRFVNPLALGSVPMPALGEHDRDAFAAVRDTVGAELAALGSAPRRLVVSSVTPVPAEG